MPTTIAIASVVLDQLDYVRPVYRWRQVAIARAFHGSAMEPARRGADQRRQACAVRLIELEREILAIKLQIGDPMAGARSQGCLGASDRIARPLIQLGSCEIERAEIVAEIAALDANGRKPPARRHSNRQTNRFVEPSDPSVGLSAPKGRALYFPIGAREFPWI
jgi:hypothetical protein